MNSTDHALNEDIHLTLKLPKIIENMGLRVLSCEPMVIRVEPVLRN